MAIFVAAFAIINVNVTLVQNALSLGTILIFNLCTVGSIAFLVWAANFITPQQPDKPTWPLLVLGVAAFAASLFI